MKVIPILLIVLACGDSSSVLAAGDTNLIIFAKDLDSSLRLEVSKSGLPIKPLSKTEVETRLQKTPPGTTLIEPRQGFRFDFFLVSNEGRRLFGSKEQYMADLGNIPQSFTVFDAVLTNKVIFLLSKNGVENFVERITPSTIVTNSSNWQAEVVCTDRISDGRIAIKGTFQMNTNKSPDVLLQFAEGIPSLWQHREGKWLECSTSK